MTRMWILNARRKIRHCTTYNIHHYIRVWYISIVLRIKCMCCCLCLKTLLKYKLHQLYSHCALNYIICENCDIIAVWLSLITCPSCCCCSGGKGHTTKTHSHWSRPNRWLLQLLLLSLQMINEHIHWIGATRRWGINDSNSVYLTDWMLCLISDSWTQDLKHGDSTDIG